MRFIREGKWLVFLLLLGFLTQVSWAGEKTQVFTGEGVAPIVNENVLTARGKALKKARLNALERAIEEILPFEVIEEKRDTIESMLSSNLRAYILETKVIKEEKEDGLYRVVIRATVNLDALKRAVIEKELMPKRGLGYRPRIMIVIPEQHLRRWIPDPAAETEIIRQFTKERFYVVDQSQVKKIRYNDKTLAAARGDSAAAAAIGRKYGAEVIITGEAFSEYVGREKGMVLCSARVEIRAIKTDTAQILYADAKDISALAVSENIAAKRALQRAGSLLGPEFIEEILAWAETAKEEGKMVTLYIPNISYTQLMIVKDTLAKKIPRVDRSIQRSFTGGIGEIEVVYRGESQELADAIQEISFDGFSLQVTNFTENRIDCEIISRKPKKMPSLSKFGINRVAVLPFTYSGNPWKKDITNEEATNIIEEYFVRTDCMVFSRTELRKIFKEQRLELEGGFDPVTVVKIGKLCGVDTVVTGSFSYFDDSDSPIGPYYYARIKMIKVETGQIIFSSSASSSLGTRNALNMIKKDLTDTFSQGYIILVGGDI